jgi:hypothetical protein
MKIYKHFLQYFELEKKWIPSSKIQNGGGIQDGVEKVFFI